MRCEMKAMIMDMCILSHKTQCFLMFGHVVGVGEGKLRTITIPILYYINMCILYIYIYISLILYSFYTTSTPLLYYIYQLNTTYIILYNSLHTTDLLASLQLLRSARCPCLAWRLNHHPRHTGRKIPEIS